MELFLLILIGAIAGWLAGQYMTGKGFGVVGDIITGVMGALIGGIFFEKTGLLGGSGGIVGLTAAATGAIICLYGVRMVRKI